MDLAANQWWDTISTHAKNRWLAAQVSDGRYELTHGNTKETTETVTSMLAIMPESVVHEFHQTVQYHPNRLRLWSFTRNDWIQIDPDTVKKLNGPSLT